MLIVPNHSVKVMIILTDLSTYRYEDHNNENVNGIILLKVLSGEMDPAESWFIRQVFIKERGAKVFREICPSPIL